MGCSPLYWGGGGLTRIARCKYTSIGVHTLVLQFRTGPGTDPSRPVFSRCSVHNGVWHANRPMPIIGGSACVKFSHWGFALLIQAATSTDSMFTNPKPHTVWDLLATSVDKVGFYGFKFCSGQGFGVYKASLEGFGSSRFHGHCSFESFKDHTYSLSPQTLPLPACIGRLASL